MEVLVAFCLLGRINQDIKLETLFSICDLDNDDCLTPYEIRNLFLLVDRVFAAECSNVTVPSTNLLQDISYKRAERRYVSLLFVLRGINKNDRFEEDKLITNAGSINRIFFCS